MRRWLLPALLFFPLLAAPAAGAQGVQAPSEGVLALSAILDTGILEQTLGPPNNVGELRISYRDESIQGINENLGFVDVHKLSFAFAGWVYNSEPENWIEPKFSPFNETQIRAGERGEITAQVTHAPSIQSTYVEGLIIVRLESSQFDNDDGTPKNVTVALKFAVRIVPMPLASIRLDPADNFKTVKPDEMVHLKVVIANKDFYGELFTVNVRLLESQGIDPANIPIQGAKTYYLGPRETREIDLSFRAPRDLFWYWFVQGTGILSIEPSRGGTVETQLFSFYIDGFYVSENYYFLLLAFIGSLILLIFLIVFAKRSYEEKYLGKPLPPWVLPEERVKLDALRQENPRAFYILRYYTMVEEYKSALLWFYTYKRISKRRLKQELKALDLRERADELAAAPTAPFDRQFARVERRYMRRIQRRKDWLERKIGHLQSRLQRNYEKDYEKDHAKWEEKVEKLRKKQQKPFLKAKAKWEKEKERLLAEWGKPFKKDLKRHAKALEKSREKYAKKVKKKDKPTYRAWRESVEDWKIENNLRRKEGKELLPEPELRSAVVGDPGHPEPPQLPPKPALPPEPIKPPLRDVPPEPQLESPKLEASHYAKKARKAERRAARKIRKIERAMAKRLEKVNGSRRSGVVAVAEKRARFEAQAASVARASFVDRILRRTPQQLEAKSRRSYLRALERQRVSEARGHEAGQVELVRLEHQKKEAELEGQIIREKAALQRASKLGRPEERAVELARIRNLELDLSNLKGKHREAFAREEDESQRRLERTLGEIRREFEERSRKEPAEAPVAAPTKS